MDGWKKTILSFGDILFLGAFAVKFDPWKIEWDQIPTDP